MDHTGVSARLDLQWDQESEVVPDDWNIPHHRVLPQLYFKIICIK